MNKLYYSILRAVHRNNLPSEDGNNSQVLYADEIVKSVQHFFWNRFKCGPLSLQELVSTWIKNPIKLTEASLLFEAIERAEQLIGIKAINSYFSCNAACINY